jgi:GR25 family glycosyltransferase involved in LPS biosynthesis
MIDIFIIFNESNKQSKISAERCKQSFDDIGLSAILFDGVWRDDAMKCAKSLDLKFGQLDESFSKKNAVVGCFLSHYQLWNKVKKLTLILEHDAVLLKAASDPFKEFIKEYQSILESHMTLMNIGKPSFGNFYVQKTPGIYKLFSKPDGKFPGCHGYLIEPKASKALIAQAHIEGIYPVDKFINNKRFNFLTELYPWPIECEDSFSSIQKEKGCLAKHKFSKDFIIL